MDVARSEPSSYWKQQIERALLAPVRAVRIEYLPLLMVYFAYGALGITTVAESFWVKRDLTWTPAELSALLVWFTLPWTIKMVFGELVDTVALLGSRRRAYVFVGAGLVASGLLLLAGAAGRWITFAGPDRLYVVAMLLVVTGVVLQDVVADAMSTEVVARVNADGSARSKQEIDHDLGMVQVLGRLALSFGVFAVAGLGGLLAKMLAYETVFLLALVVPLISVSGALIVRLEASEPRPIDWRILGGGIAFGAAVTVLALSGLAFSQEIVFLFSMAVVIWMLRRVTDRIDPQMRTRIFYAAVIIFAFRAVPGIGEGYRWFAIDVLGFDEAFYGITGQLGAGIAILATWMFADVVTRKPVAKVLLWITLLGAALSMTTLALVLRWYETTERLFGIGPRSIALFDAAAASPLLQLSMIPLLTLVAIYAPAGHRAIWFALMASLMNLALMAGGLGGKYLNLLFPVDRGMYDNLPSLAVAVIVVGLLLPLAAIVAFGRRVR